MAKRFIDTTLWTQNKWFRTLPKEFKLLWIYLFCNCDMVGVWEEDLELASFIIGTSFTRENINEYFSDKIKWINGKKLWIVDFCYFQYGELKEENINNKPHQSYISLLKKHSLWIDYTKSIYRVKEKDIYKDKDIEKEKEKEKDIDTRKQKFLTELEAYSNGKYTTKMLQDFYNYWTELNPSKTRMHFEMEKTFEIGKRLATWLSNENKYKSKNGQQKHYGSAGDGMWY